MSTAKHIVIPIGKVIHTKAGKVFDETFDVEFTGFELGRIDRPGHDKDGEICDSRGTRYTLYETYEGELILHIRDWSLHHGENTNLSVRRVTNDDLQDPELYALARQVSRARPEQLKDLLERQDQLLADKF